MIQKLLLKFVKQMITEHGAEVAQQVIEYILALLDSKETGGVAAVPAGLSMDLVTQVADFVSELED